MIRSIQLKTVVSGLWVMCFILFSCDESLPPYEQPRTALAITSILVSQGLIDAGYPILNIYIVGENQYEETFDDTVHVRGEVRIRWKRHPEITAALPLNNGHFVAPTLIHGSRLTLDPAEEFYMQNVWYLSTDDGEYLIDLLDYSAHDVRGDFEYAKPETLVIEVEMLVFEQIGMIRSEPVEFEFFGYRPVKGDL